MKFWQKFHHSFAIWMLMVNWANEIAIIDVNLEYTAWSVTVMDLGASSQTQFLAELFCSLTENSLGTEVSCRWHADNVWTTCGQCADDTRVRLHWRFQLADDICCPDIVCMSSACHPQPCTSSAGVYVICMSSAALLMVSVDLNYLSTVTGTGYWMEFVTRMLSCFISGSYKWFAR